MCSTPHAPPLSRLHADLPWGSLELLLSERLGSGGYSDAYSLLSAVPGAEGRGCVLKVARCASDKMAAQYKQEARHLQALAAAHAPRVPLLLAAGERSGLQRWPLLVLTPCCRPLATALDAHLAAADSQQSKREARLQFARQVLLQTQEALRAAHALGIFHCDTRVDHVRADERGNVCLIDWGLARGRGVSALRVGVPAFALGAQFDGTSSCAACERVDLSAAALLWLCVAYGQCCRAPWPTAVTKETAATERSEWLCKRAARGYPLLSSVAARLTELEAARWRCVPDDYSWTPL
jgi:serine/threonine protein kinase